MGVESLLIIPYFEDYGPIRCGYIQCPAIYLNSVFFLRNFNYIDDLFLDTLKTSGQKFKSDCDYQKVFTPFNFFPYLAWP